MVSHSCVVESYRGKFWELAKYPEADIHLVIPGAWPEHNQWVTARKTDRAPFETHITRAYRLGRVASYFYHPIAFEGIVRHVRPDVVLAEEEPWSLAAWQCLVSSRSVSARLVFFTWENVWRRYKWISEKILLSVLRHADAAVAGNKEAVGILRRRGFSGKVEQIPQHGVTIAAIDRNDPSPPRVLDGLRRPRMAFLGRLEREKGVDVLLNAVSRLDGTWSLVIIGNGSEREKLLRLAEDLHIDHRVRFLPGIPHGDVPMYLGAVDILVLPSIATPTWKEQFGRVLAEAMAAGAVVVGSDSGAIPEVVGDAGMIFPEGDSPRLSDVLRSLLQSPHLRLELVRRGRQAVLARYSDEIVGARFFSLFAALAGKPTVSKTTA